MRLRFPIESTWTVRRGIKDFGPFVNGECQALKQRFHSCSVAFRFQMQSSTYLTTMFPLQRAAWKRQRPESDAEEEEAE